MPHATYQVHRFCRRTRASLEVLASGLTMRAASSLAATLRADDAANEAAVGYGVQTMSLAAQLAHGESLGLLRAALDPAPFTLAA